MLCYVPSAPQHYIVAKTQQLDEDWCQTVHNLANEVEINYGTCQQIVTAEFVLPPDLCLGSDS